MKETEAFGADENRVNPQSDVEVMIDDLISDLEDEYMHHQSSLEDGGGDERLHIFATTMLEGEILELRDVLNAFRNDNPVNSNFSAAEHSLRRHSGLEETLSDRYKNSHPQKRLEREVETHLNKMEQSSSPQDFTEQAESLLIEIAAYLERWG